METPVNRPVKVRVKSQNTRKNFGSPSARKRGEANFMLAFERAWFAKQQTMGLAAGEFALAGFGVADLVWIGWPAKEGSGEFTALALERQLKKRLLHAFEGKLSDWRRALQQAFRYRYFADKAIVVMPAAKARAAVANLEVFREHAVGLWTFDPESGAIREHHTPTRVRAFNVLAREKAIAALSSKINFRQLRKQA